MNVHKRKLLNRKMVAEARTLPFIEGESDRQLEMLAEKYGLKAHRVKKTLMRYRLRTKVSYNFLAGNIRVLVESRVCKGEKYPKGFCLMCKCGDPANAVPLYQGKNAPVCPACNGTGKYLDEIMHKKGRLDDKVKQLCLENETYEGFLQACDSNNEDPVSRKSWYGFRREQKRRDER